jgi:hypothetical protein
MAIHAQAFRAWLLEDYSILDDLARTAAESLNSGAARTAGDVATLGYAHAASRLGSSFATGLADGLEWLGERTWFRPHHPLTLESDGVAAFGIALAFRGQPSGTPPEWLQQLVVRSATSPGLTSLDHSLFVAAAHVLNAKGRQDLTEISPEVRLGVAKLSLGGVDDACYRDAWQRILCFTESPECRVEATLLLRALDLITEHNLPARLGRLGPEDLVRVLEGVKRSFRRWTWEDAPRTRRSAAARWEMENEYHVQNFLWAILAPLFPDMNDEETLPPVGQKNPRVDLSIPSLSTIVEVKFVRAGTPFQDTIEEIAADASLYGTDPRWRSLIPFVWDDARRTEEHAKLVAGLLQLPMVIGPIVISRPAKMKRPEAGGAQNTESKKLLSSPKVKVDMR